MIVSPVVSRMASQTADYALIGVPAGVTVVFAQVGEMPKGGAVASICALLALLAKLYFSDRQATRTQGLPLLNAELARVKDALVQMEKRNNVVVGRLHVAEALAGRASILLVEDSEAMGYAEAKALRSAGFRVRCVQTVADGLREFDIEPPDTLAVDLKLDDGDGETILRHAIASGFVCNLVVLTGETDPVRLAAVRAIGAHVLTKPIDGHSLISACRPDSTGGGMPTIRGEGGPPDA